MPGRALPAAQPHTEFTTIISDALGVLHGVVHRGGRLQLFAPISVISPRIGAINILDMAWVLLF